MIEIKQKIKEILETVKPGSLKDVILEQRQKKDPLEMDIPSYPVAFVGAGAIIENDFHDNVTYQMTVAHSVTVLMKAENHSDMNEVEELMYELVLLFINSETLGENCLWIKPTTTEPTVFTHTNRQLIEFTINLEVRKLVFKATP